ncbi:MULTISPECIES: fasciclin domain-containing protein [Flavobacterium]|uniref:fasciclin domain-containing protein n=1 Tax=Flavobacterium TaxID=237 RepID=UPI001FCB5C88|nr:MULTISPECIES: fasciclin domain-containing protein [Flavobacterium]UOK43342.1 fasciclin domain-containing protein [Flavobacterium enshiense]
MKTLSKFFGIAVLAFVSFSCEDDDNITKAPEQTIAEIAVQNPNLSILVQALEKVDLVSTFNSPGDYTVFAPTNDKFQAFLSANGFANLDAVPNEILAEVLKNHVLTGSFTSSELETGYVKTLAKGNASSSNTLSMYIDLTSGVKLNGGADNGGASVVLSSANIKASNGVIHVIDNVIDLPTIVNHAVANPNFTNLVAALTRPDVTDQNFTGVLNGTAGSPFTVFAPTNEAFTSLLEELGLSSLTAVPKNVLEETLKYHVVTGANVLSSQLTNNQIVSTLQGQSFTIGLAGGAKITDAQNRVSNIIATDVQCTNGVIHVIDKVILPTF